ncbi:MAG TPA: BON domain-containing protein [Vicinamibacterales bacterium]|nr:BON domain-containing protein [Vicinamibacterales bacterium]
MLTASVHKKLVVLVVLILLGAVLRADAAVSDAELTRNIQRQISGLDYGAQRPVVMVSEGVVTLTGTVATLWLKQETISRVLKVEGIARLVSELTIPRAESDEKLAMEVVDKIQHYDLFTVYDYFQGGVKNGVVHLSGAVTEPKKLDDVVERVAKVRGVQEIDNKVTVLPANQEDDRLRLTIARAIYSQPDFERYSMANPPIHVLVDKGHVTLVGVVRSEIEKRKAFEAARFVNGVLALDDKVVVARR